ncbi:unnamed protein product [Albugo candida]|uniref:Uncharacterized protein n=1 Tax=Albugo candida TaxID=65357 RepID=A0A024G2N0_9STRA|nr:unnamed protein product [Albugo candida]|eukprot:CCI40573.1 unnamed protein product [Albugo candida]
MEVEVTEGIHKFVKPEEIDEVAVFTSHDTLQTVPEDICTTAQPDILRLTTSSTVTAVLKSVQVGEDEDQEAKEISQRH